MKKQHIVFSIDEKMQILAKADAHVGTPVDLAATFVLSLLMLHTILSKRSEIVKSYSHCGPSFANGCKSLKTSPLGELEIILSAWFKQALTANVSINGPHLKEEALHAAARLGIHGCRASTQPGIQDNVGRKCHCKSQNSDGLEE